MIKVTYTINEQSWEYNNVDKIEFRKSPFEKGTPDEMIIYYIVDNGERQKLRENLFVIENLVIENNWRS
jgi:hypothetical protein